MNYNSVKLFKTFFFCSRLLLLLLELLLLLYEMDLFYTFFLFSFVSTNCFRLNSKRKIDYHKLTLHIFTRVLLLLLFFSLFFFEATKKNQKERKKRNRLSSTNKTKQNNNVNSSKKGREECVFCIYLSNNCCCFDFIKYPRWCRRLSDILFKIVHAHTRSITDKQNEKFQPKITIKIKTRGKTYTRNWKRM